MTDFFRSSRYQIWKFILVHGLLRFANYYSDHMVLSRAPQRAIVWGFSNSSNTPITLTMNNKVYYAKRSSSSSVDGNDVTIWLVTLDPQYQEGPFQVKVTQPLPNRTLETITLDDVLFGDVWICSGQSNMQYNVHEMFNASVEIQNANKYPKVRLFHAAVVSASTPQEELIIIPQKWSVASNTTVAGMSAVCWLYGRMIQEGLGGRPIGLIHSSCGGTNIELWTPPEVLKDCGVTQ
jgi:sialate O-acetylesterase